MRRAGEQRRRCIGLMAGVFAFLFQLSAWAWFPPVAVADTLTIPICTPAGMTYKAISLEAVSADADKQAGDLDLHSFDHGCPLCPLISGLSVPPPDISVALPSELSRHNSIGLPGERIAAGWFLSTLQARAPPAA